MTAIEMKTPAPGRERWGVFKISIGKSNEAFIAPVSKRECELVHTAPPIFAYRVRVWLSASADVGRGIIEPARRCFIAPAGDREAHARIPFRAETIDRRMACRRIVRTSVVRGVCRRAQDDQEAQGQN